jgi:hypothetical protein
MKQNSVNAAVMTAPGKFEVRRYPYPEIDDVSMVIELECAASAERTSTRSAARRCNMRGRPRSPIRPFRSFPGTRSWARSPRSAGLPVIPSNMPDKSSRSATGSSCARHSLRQVLVLQEYVRLSAVPEHQRLRQRFHLTKARISWAAGPTIFMSARTPSCSRSRRTWSRASRSCRN